MVVDVSRDKLHVFIIMLLLTCVAGLDIVLIYWDCDWAFQLRQWQSGFLIVGLAGVASPPKAVYRLSLSEIILASLDLTNAGLAIGWAGELL